PRCSSPSTRYWPPLARQMVEPFGAPSMSDWSALVTSEEPVGSTRARTEQPGATGAGVGVAGTTVGAGVGVGSGVAAGAGGVATGLADGAGVADHGASTLKLAVASTRPATASEATRFELLAGWFCTPSTVT